MLTFGQGKAATRLSMQFALTGLGPQFTRRIYGDYLTNECTMIKQRANHIAGTRSQIANTMAVRQDGYGAPSPGTVEAETEQAVPAIVVRRQLPEHAEYKAALLGTGYRGE